MISKPRFWKKHNELHIVTLKNRDPDILDHLFQKMCYLDEDNHLCYLRAFSSDLEPDKFIFYDFECTQEEGKQNPIL